jgi:hypothetical protein
MRVFLITAVLAGGCSFGMKPLPSDYDERTIPRCETAAINPVGDALGAVLFAAGAVALAIKGGDAPSAEEPSDREAAVGIGLVALAFGGVAALGFSWDSACVAAKKQWDERQIEQDTLVREHKRDASIDREIERAKVERESTPAVVPAPRGFYCSASPTAPLAGICTRQKTECARMRDMVSAADMTECALVETAWCFDMKPGDERCAPVEAACDAQRRRGTDALPDDMCAERQ